MQQRQEPIRASVPRVPDPKPLTAIEAIPVPEPIIEQEVLPIPVPDSISEPINLTINLPPPIESIIINEIEVEESEETNIKKTEVSPPDNPYGYSKRINEVEEYDPYGYYSGPKF